MKKQISQIYHDILTDKEIIKIYETIEENEKKAGRYAFHNLKHIENVTITVEKILKDLKYEEEFIEKAKIACLLHDTGAVYGKEGHALKSYEYAKNYFSKNNITFEDIDLVLEAIKIHSDGFETDNIIALSLILADKLDVRKSRITQAGKKVVGNRQYTHIINIQIDILKGKMRVCFMTDGKIDFKELNEYYFTKKIFKSIRAFANKLKLQYEVLLDNQVWNFEESE